MDNQLLNAVVESLASRLATRRLEDVRQESGHRFRLCWGGVSGEDPLYVVISLDPESPWMGEVLQRPTRKRAASGSLAATLRRALEGQRLERLSKPTVDRWIQFEFASGARLIAELATHQSNIVLVDDGGRTVASLRRPKRATERLAPGGVWAPPTIPPAAARRLESELNREGGLLAEFAIEGAPPLSVQIASHFDRGEREAFADERRNGLLQILKRERRRLTQAFRKAGRDRENFEDPERYQRWAVAILAGLSQARSHDHGVQLPDPEAPEGADLIIPTEPGLPLPKLAEKLFARHRRALRGQQRATERAQQLESQLRQLEQIAADDELSVIPEGELEARMRAAGLSVGLAPQGRAARLDRHRRLPRLEGVRIYTATSGESILAGKGGKENHRLTFKLAGAEDFWFHALGVPGAHVVLRNPDRLKRPAEETLREAAAVAAFHSDASNDEWVDIQWTLRKNVRKPRQAPMGTVVLKRFETVRVRPGLP